MLTNENEIGRMDSNLVDTFLVEPERALIFRDEFCDQS